MNFIVKFIKAGIGLFLMVFNIRVFRPKKIFYNKSIAIVGPADSAYDNKNGDFIDSFDYVIRLNKALVNWDKEKELFIGRRTDILVHSFQENYETGGGPLDIKLFHSHGVKYLVNAKNYYFGYRTILNFYKKYLNNQKVYLLSRKYFKEGEELFLEKKPTNGFWAIFMALNGQPQKVYITGFTFFKTPYQSGYRDKLKDVSVNENHIKERGIHDPELEFSIFKKFISQTQTQIILDNRLSQIIKNDSELNYGKTK